MRKLIFMVITIIVFLIGIVPPSGAVTRLKLPSGLPQDTLPVPQGIKNLLFYVQRDPNKNTVVYEVNLNANGTLNEKEPVKIYWIRYAEKGERKELSYIQRKFAYGLDVKKLSPERYELQFVCYGKLSLYLQKGDNGKYQVYTSINQKPAILNRVFVSIKGGTFWVPNVQYVELVGKTTENNLEVKRRFKP